MDIYLLSFLICFVSLTFLWIRRRNKKFSVFSDNGIPGPKPNFWLGNTIDFAQKRENFELECRNKYGNVFGFFLGPKPFLVVSDQNLIKKIQVEEFKRFNNKDTIIPDAGVPHSIIYKTLPFLRDNEWKINRSISNPTFTSGKLKKMSFMMNEIIDDFIEIIKTKSKTAEPFDIYPLYKTLSLDIICRIGFGIISEIQKGKNNVFVESVAKVLTSDSIDILPLLSICFPEIEPIPTKLRQLIDVIKTYLGFPSIKFILDTTHKLIQQRKQSSQRNEDLLQNLIEGKIEVTKLNMKIEDSFSKQINEEKTEHTTDNSTNSKNLFSLSNEQINGISLSYIVGGYDTTSSTLAYATYYLAAFPDIQEKAREEVKAIVDDQGKLQYEDLQKLTYLEQVIFETLRFHPLAFLVYNRIAKESFRYNDMIIPKNTTVIIPVSLLQRDPDNWPNPDKFDPERFSPENKQNINPYKYQPFGYGPRICVGMRFALIEMKFTLARLLLTCKFEKSEFHELKKIYSMFVNHPKEVIIRVIS